MRLLGLRLKADLRGRWASFVLLTLVIAIGGGASLTAFAGARRANSAMGRFVAYSLPDTGGFGFGDLASPPVQPGRAGHSLSPPPAMKRVVDLSQVVAYFREPTLFVATERQRPQIGLQVVGAADPDLMRTVDRPLVLSGHLPAPGQASAVVVDQLGAQRDHLRVGSHLRLYAYAWTQVAHVSVAGGSPQAGAGTPRGPSFVVSVTAIVRFPQDVNAVLPREAAQAVPYLSHGTVYTTPAFVARLAARLRVPVQALPGMNLVGVRLAHGKADWSAFAAQALKLDGKYIFLPPPENTAGVFTAADSAQRGISLEVVALLMFGAVAGAVTVLLVAQALARQSARDAQDWAALRALGMTGDQLVAETLLKAVFVGVAGGLLAALGAVLASPLMPIGLARQAEISPGLQVDPVVLAAGVACIALLLVLALLAPTRRLVALALGQRQYLDDRGTAARLATAASRASLPPPVAVGLGLGVRRGRGNAGVPVASGLFGAIIAIAAIAASLTVDHSLSHLLGSPHQQGWNWDVLAGNPSDTGHDEASLARTLSRDHFVSAYSTIAILAGDRQGTAVIDGEVVPTLLAFDPLKGSVYPPLVQGRAPRAADEIVLGTHTLQTLGRRIGQWVKVEGVPVPRFRVVGTMVVPSVGDVFTNGMGDGAWVYGPAVMAAVDRGSGGPGSGPGQTGAPPTVFNLFAVQFVTGTSVTADTARLRQQFGDDVLQFVPAEDVVNLQDVDALPLILAGLVGAVGLLTLGNVLLVSVRRRSRELAILKTIGFDRRQVAVAVACQAIFSGVIALLLGLPAGVVTGRWAWGLISTAAGSGSPPAVPTLGLVAIVPVTLMACLCVAAVPGWSAVRVSPVDAMRREAGQGY